jgi:hypothetical protein
MRRVRVLRDAIDRGDPNPILVESITAGGFVTFAIGCHGVTLLGDVRMRFEPDAPLADGTRVWIECDDVRGVTRSV